MRNQITNIGLIACLSVAWAACGGDDGAHLVGKVIYEDPIVSKKRDVPPDANEQVGDCTAAGLSTANALGFADLPPLEPPVFVGLWPVAKESRPENHGNTDSISVGAPRSGDNPFAKKVVCNKDEFLIDWKTGQALEGEYFIGAWLDLDFNGFPSAGEPFGTFRGDDGSETSPGDATAPVAVRFDGTTPLSVVIRLGEEEAELGPQLEQIREALEEALTLAQESPDEAQNLFLNQFQPLLYEDAFNRSFNELTELWTDLTHGVFPASNNLEWVTEPGASAKRANDLLLTQNMDPAVFTYKQTRQQRVEMLVGDRQDAVYQIIDWRPLYDQSGDLSSTIAEFPPFTSASVLSVPFDYASPVTAVWIGVEQFVPSVTTTTGGAWELLASTTANENPSLCGISPGSFTVTLSPGAAAGCLELERLALDDTGVMRLTIMPIDWSGAEGYLPWPSFQSAASEPTRGNYLRLWFYGDNYNYRTASADRTVAE